MAHYDLIVIGAGSGNMLFNAEIEGLKTAIVEADKFGGTCLNRGCIPSKMFVVAADAARGVTEAARLGISAHLDPVDWPAIRDRVFGRIDPLHGQAVAHRCKGEVDVLTGAAKFVGPREIQVGDDLYSADKIVIATGSRPVVPPIPGLDTVMFHTSDTIMRLDTLPASMIILGGGFIAAEMGHVFEAFGTKVSIIQRDVRLLMPEDEEISASFTDMAAERFSLYLESTTTSVAATDAGVAVTIETPEGSKVLEADVLLLATGRQPNTDLIGADAAGLELDEHGHLVTDDHFQTTVPGVWAFGDAANHYQLKHLANAEMRVIAHNITHPKSQHVLGDRAVPHAVFSDPQVAGVGLTQAQADEQGLDYLVATQAYSKTAYGWALEDTTSYVKVLADRNSRKLLGAHIIGPQAALLLQPLVQAIMLGQTVDQVGTEVIYVHPALSEVIEQALLAL